MIMPTDFESSEDLKAELQNNTELIGTVESSNDIFYPSMEPDQRFIAEFHENSSLNTKMDNIIKVPTGSYEFGHGLIYNRETNTVSVDVVNDVIEGELRPITSAAVQVQVGNIEVILRTI